MVPAGLIKQRASGGALPVSYAPPLVVRCRGGCPTVRTRLRLACVLAPLPGGMEGVGGLPDEHRLLATTAVYNNTWYTNDKRLKPQHMQPR